MQSALTTTTERNPIMMRDPSNPLGPPILATVYTVGVLRVTLDDESGRPLAVRTIAPDGADAWGLFRTAYIHRCIADAQRRHRLTLEG